MVGGVGGFAFDGEGVAVVVLLAKDWSHAVRASSLQSMAYPMLESRSGLP